MEMNEIRAVGGCHGIICFLQACVFWVAGYVRVASYAFRVTGCGLRVSGYELRVTRYGYTKGRWMMEDRFARKQDDRMSQPSSPLRLALHICARNCHQVKS